MMKRLLSIYRVLLIAVFLLAIVVRMDINTNYAYAAVIFSDTFDRADSATVGNSWTESESSVNATASIASNNLRLLLGGSEVGKNVYLHHTGTTHQGIVMSFTFNEQNNDGNGSTYYYAKNDGTTGNGLGVNIDTWDNAVNLVDGTTVKATSGFTFDDTVPSSVTYNVELIIFSDYAMEARVWAVGGTKPTAATVASSAFTPVAAGTNYMIVENDFNAGAATDVRINNFTVNDSVASASSTNSSFKTMFQFQEF